MSGSGEIDVLRRHHVNVSGHGTQPMLFAHGFGCDQNMWRLVAPAFEPDYQVVLFDHAGAGRSDASAFEPESYGTLQRYADDVVEICSALGLSRVIFVGHSVSAMIGVLAAVTRPELFDRLILVAPSPRYINDAGYIGGFTREEVDALFEVLDSNYLGWSSTMAPIIMGNPGRPELAGELTDSFCRMDPAIARQFARVTFLSDNRADLPKLQTPSLILQCSSDPLAPPSVGEYLRQSIADSELVLLQATGHCPNLSAPEETIAAMSAYLSKGVTDLTSRSGHGGMIEPGAEELYEHAPCGYLSTRPDGRIVKANRTLLTWLGYAAEDLMSMSFQDLLGAGGRIFHETHYAPLLRMQGFVNEIAFDLLRKDGRLLPVLVNTSQRTDESGRPHLHWTTVFDATNRRKYERELLLARQRAEQAVQAKRRFLAVVCHEIRTPVNSLVGVAHLLEGSVSPEEQAQYLRIFRSSASALLDLTMQILDFSRIESGAVLEERPFHLRQLIEAAVSGHRAAAEARRLALEVSVDPRLPDELIGDPVKIRQVLANLLGNAVKFTHEGYVRLELRLAELQPKFASIDWRVEDSGIGIPPGRLPHIFDEFTQAGYDVQMKYGGTGLGLAVCQKLLALYGRSLDVTSVPGSGTVFAFNLRLSQAQPSE